MEKVELKCSGKNFVPSAGVPEAVAKWVACFISPVVQLFLPSMQHLQDSCQPLIRRQEEQATLGTVYVLHDQPK